MSHIERRQKEKEEIKQRILEAAAHIGVTEGWHSLTIRKIADAISYTPPIVYEYFENKENLIKELVLGGFKKMSAGFLKASAIESDPKKILRTASIAQWDFAFSNKELFQLMFSLERPIPDEEITANVQVFKNAFLKLSRNDEKLMHELIFNWMCLTHGAISIVMKMHVIPHQEERDPRDIYISIVDRFLNNI